MKPNLRAVDNETVDEYPPEARFAWDMIAITDEEADRLCDFADAGMVEEADAVVDAAADRMFGAIQ